MSRRHEQAPAPPTFRFRTSSAPAPASLLGGSGDAGAPHPPARINLPLSGWLQDRFPLPTPPPLPLASLSSACSTAAAAPTLSTTTTLTHATNLCFELAAAARALPPAGGNKGRGAGQDDTHDDDDDSDDDSADDATLLQGRSRLLAGGGGGLVGAAVRPRRRQQAALAEAPDRAVAALERVNCSGCQGPLVPAPGETSQPRRRRAAALARVCAGCRKAFHAPCAAEVAGVLGGRTLLRLAPGAPPPWESPEGGGALLAALTGRGPPAAAAASAASGSNSKQRGRGSSSGNKGDEEGVTEELERLLREEEAVRAAVARDGCWFHSFPCARVGAALAAQAAIGPVGIDPPPPPPPAKAEEDEAGGAAAGSNAPAAAAAASPFAWLKSMREAAMQRLPASAAAGGAFDFDPGEDDDVDDNDALPPLERLEARERRLLGGGGMAQEQEGQQSPAAAVKIQPRPGPPLASSRTWALVDLSRLRAEPGDRPPAAGRTGPGSRLRPDVDALIDVLMQSYGPGAADVVVGLTAAAMAAEEEEEEAERARERAEARRAAAAAAGGAAATPVRPRPSPRRRLGGGLRDGRYAVLLRDSAERGAAPLCAALLESYGPEAAVLDLLATRVSRRGEGHAAALLDTTATFLRDALGTRRVLAAGVPAASDPVCRGLFLGSGGEQAVKREQARVQAELRRQKGGGGGGGGDGAPEGGGAGGGAAAAGDGDLVAGLLAVMGSPSLVPYVGKDSIHWSPPHAPRFRRLGRREAGDLAAALPALGRRLEAAGSLKGSSGGRKRGGVFGWLFGGGGGGGGGSSADGTEWLVKDLTADGLVLV